MWTCIAIYGILLRITYTQQDNNHQQRRGYHAQKNPSYQVCLLSNTNPFMTMWTDSPAFDSQGHPMSYFFDKLYLSYECGVMKPAPEIYKNN